MLISEPIWEVWEHSKSHWTSPLGPLGGCGGLGSLNGAKHSLPGSFSAKSGVKTCKVTDLYKNIGILHFKPRRIRISRWLFHWLTFEGVENQDFQEHVPILDTFRGFSQGKWTNRSPPHRYSESPWLNPYSNVSLVSRSLVLPCYGGRVSSDLGGIWGHSEI